MAQKEPISKKMLLDSKVKSAILFLTSGQIPKDENFDFVIEAMEEFKDDQREYRQFLFEAFYDELLEWASLNSL